MKLIICYEPNFKNNQFKSCFGNSEAADDGLEKIAVLIKLWLQDSVFTF